MTEVIWNYLVVVFDMEDGPTVLAAYDNLPAARQYCDEYCEMWGNLPHIYAYVTKKGN